MGAGEFGVSLSRELTVCSNAITRIKKSLSLLERKHNMTTDRFIEKRRSGMLEDSPEAKYDYEAWESSFESLRQWEELERKCREALRRMNP